METEGRPLDEEYLEWLYRKAIGALKAKNPSVTYWKLAVKLSSTRFEWHISHDENRAEEGKGLRDEFIDEMEIQDIEIGWLQEDCSTLEMFIALAQRAAFESNLTPGDWFWVFMENLGLKEYNDRAYDEDAEQHIDEVCDRVNHRKYQRNGAGGLFPLRHATQDQRNIELWYQLAAYLLEGRYRGL